MSTVGGSDLPVVILAHGHPWPFVGSCRPGIESRNNAHTAGDSIYIQGLRRSHLSARVVITVLPFFALIIRRCKA